MKKQTNATYDECMAKLNQEASECVAETCAPISGGTFGYGYSVYTDCNQTCQTCGQYYCPSGWYTYSGSGSSLMCYKSASYI